MKKNSFFIIIIALIRLSTISGQTVLNIYPDSLLSPVNVNFTPGVNYVPKTQPAINDFMSNGIQQNSIRTFIIESALNKPTTTNLQTCLSYLDLAKTVLQDLSSKCDKLIFPIERMPDWLSSSADRTIISGFSNYMVLNTKPPANWNTWQTVIDSITSKIVIQFGIANAYFEIWNEPDIGSWGGTMSEYFMLYKRTYDGIKSPSHPTARAGGPTVNGWKNNIYWKPPSGYISNTKADSSLIGQLLDSSVIWNKVPDFISWHNFDISYQEFVNAANYIEQKRTSLSLPTIPLIVSEWNAPSAVRDTRLATSFMIKAQLELSKTGVSNNAISAWQDFFSSTTEFHNDYGLLSWGSIHKPAYNSILLSEKLKGTTCKMSSAAPFDGASTVVNDTLSVLISNYCPHPFLEAYNNTLYQGRFNVIQLDSAGYIDIAASNPNPLDSIYRGLITLPGSNAMQIAINNSKSVYQHYSSIATSPRQFKLNLSGYTGNYSGQLFIVDSTKNNMQFKYDSLRSKGYTQSAAISYILPIQGLKSTTVAVNSGQYTFSLQPNAVCLFKIKIPGVNSITENNMRENNFIVYPNPATEKVTVTFLLGEQGDEQIQVYNSMGDLVKSVAATQIQTTFDVSDLSSGLYFIQPKNNPQQTQKFIKQ